MTDDEEKNPVTTAHAWLASLNRCQPIFETVNCIVWEVDAQTQECTFISDSVSRILGYTPDEWLGQPFFWEAHLFPEDRDTAIAKRQKPELPGQSFEYRMIKADGGIVWVRDMVSVRQDQGGPRSLLGVMVDITEAKLLSELDRLEKEVLELNAGNNKTIESVLSFYIKGIEMLFPQMKCSILRVNDNKLSNWVSPSLPEAYTSGIINKTIGPLAGSCGAAAYFKRKVIVNDIANDEIWAQHKQYALPFNLLACWSYPIINSQGIVIATFGIYYHKVTNPDSSHIDIITRSAQILKIILENRLYAEMLLEANALISQGQELANFGTWLWDIEKDIVSWSDVLYDIYGLDRKDYMPTYAGYMERIHFADRGRVEQIIVNALKTSEEIVFEERVLCPDGSVKYLKSWVRTVTGNTGKPVKMIGASLDITQAKTTRIKMDEIAWLQSHVIRAPLARLIGLINILHDELKPGEGHTEIFDGIFDTARELDLVIHTISDNTKL